jgi:hypothetical protein
MQRIQFSRLGGPEVLELVEGETPRPAPGQVLLRQEAVGLNFIDTYYRTGLYAAELPSGLGNEAAGVVEAIGPDVDGFNVGDRVGYPTGPLGAYASHRVVDAIRLVPIPAGISSEQAAAAMLKGCTAEYLVERCANVLPGQTVLVHAAAGGVGSILVQWLKTIGAMSRLNVTVSAASSDAAGRHATSRAQASRMFTAKGSALSYLGLRSSNPPSPSTAPRDERSFAPYALGIYGVALLIRFLHVWQLSRSPFFDALLGDAHGYDEWARRIAGGEWIGTDVFYQAPLYPYFLGVIYKLFGHSLLVVRIIQAAGSA